MMAAPVSARGSFPPGTRGPRRTFRPIPAAARSGKRGPASPGYRDGDGGLAVLAPTEPCSSSHGANFMCLCRNSCSAASQQLFQYKQVKFLPLFWGYEVLWQHHRGLNGLKITRAKGCCWKAISLLEVGPLLD